MAKSRQRNDKRLAWAGWQMRVPEDWRPVRIEGAWMRGSMIVGDADEAIMQVKWWRPTKRDFDPGRWIRRRLKKVGRRPADRGPAPHGLSHSAWAPAEPNDGRGAFWYGCASDGGLVIEVVTSAALAKKAQRTVSDRVLPTLTVSAPDRATRWAIFGASFESPPGFSLRNQRVHLGDVVLQLSSSRRDTLLLRQVYPAELALARRELAKWLAFPVFKEHRKFRGAETEWSVDSFGRKLEGVKRAGRKRLPSPLGFCAPRRSVAAVVHDDELGRLLVAEYDSLEPGGDDVVAAALGAMNWAQLGPEDGR